MASRIQNPKDSSDDRKKVGSSHSSLCKIKITKANQNWSKDPWYPKNSSVGLTFTIESAEGCAPRIRLTQDLKRPEHTLNAKGHQVPVHSGSIDLAFGRIFKSDEDESTNPNQIFNLKVDYKQDHANALISFDTTGATANNLKCLIEFPEGHDRVRYLRLCDYEREMTKQLCSLTAIPEGKVKHVTILIEPHPKEKELHTAGQQNAVDDLLDALPFEGNVSESLKQSMTVLPYNQWRNASHKPRIQHGQMPKNFKVFEQNHACMPMPPRYSWQDADEANIVLANSIAVQHTESTIIPSSLEQDQHKVELLIEAVATTYARESWVTKKWPALLNDGAKLAPKALVDSIDCSREQYEQAYNEFITSHSWNKRQIAHIDTFLQAPGGMAALVGARGSGKTEVMIRLMRFCFRIGIKVLCLGVKHTTLDLIVKKYESKFPNEEQPLRAYTQSMESFTSLDKRSRLPLTNSIQHRVIENSKIFDMAEMKRAFPSSFENGVPVYADETEYDFRQVFRDGLAARDEHPFSDREYWDDDRFAQFKYAYAALRAEVIQNSRLLVATMVNVSSTEISQNFSHNTPIARFDDTAQTCSEQTSLVAAATCGFSSNICAWAMYGDLEQSGVINPIGDNTEDTADVFYQQSDISLFLRLYVAGHSFNRLTTQWRQHESLFKPLNELHYFLGVKTVGNMKLPLKKHNRLMGTIAGRSDKEIDAQTDIQQRLLRINVNSPNMKSKDSPSRANPGFAVYTVRGLLPEFRHEYGITMSENVMLVVPYAKHKQLYQHWFVKLRQEGWTESELPKLTTIDAAHSHEANAVIFDTTNDDYEGFLDPARLLIAMSRARHQLVIVSGSMSKVDKATETKRVRDATKCDEITTITLKRPILHWFQYCEDNLCFYETLPPKFEVPSDLAFYDAA